MQGAERLAQDDVAISDYEMAQSLGLSRFAPRSCKSAGLARNDNLLLDIFRKKGYSPFKKMDTNFRKFLERIVTKKVTFFLLMDIALLSLAMFASFLLRFDSHVPSEYRQYLWYFILASLAAHLSVFWWQGLYRLSWSYVSVFELVKIVKATILGAIFLAILLFVFKIFYIIPGFPRSIIFVNHFLVLIFIGGLRSLKRIYYEMIHKERLVDNARGEDLIERDQVELDKNLIRQFLFQKRVLITGAAGSVGQELVKQVIPFRPRQLILVDQDETGIFDLNNFCLAVPQERQTAKKIDFHCVVANILNKSKMQRIFKKYHPQVVFHAAAYKHVPVMEQDPCEAVRNNIIGTWILAKIVLKNRVDKFVLISTDKAVNPTSVMGVTKRIAEILISYLNKKQQTKFMAVRFGNVLGSRGSVVPIFKEQIKQGGPITITHPEMERYFMVTAEACQLVIQAGAYGQGGEIFVLDMGRPIKIVDLACRLIQMSGLRPHKDIRIVFTGLRPGEKVIEEVLTAEEGTQVTQYRKIYRATLNSDLVDEQFLILLHELVILARQGKKIAVKEVFKKMVKNYQTC